jgi:hypothetical protein
MMMSKRVLIALFAVLTELVVVAATGNQALLKYLNQHDSTLWVAEVRDAFVSFTWRVTPLSGQTTPFVAQFAAIATLIVLTFVLVIIILRGPATFSGAFFTAACVTVASAVVANMVESVVDYNRLQTGGSVGDRVSVAIVDGSRTPGLLSYSVAMALVVALVSGIAGASIRRRANLEQLPDAAAPFDAAGPPEDQGGSGYSPGDFYLPPASSEFGGDAAGHYPPPAGDPAATSPYGYPSAYPTTPLEPAESTQPSGTTETTVTTRSVETFVPGRRDDTSQSSWSRESSESYPEHPPSTSADTGPAADRDADLGPDSGTEPAEDRSANPAGGYNEGGRPGASGASGRYVLGSDVPETRRPSAAEQRRHWDTL